MAARRRRDGGDAVPAGTLRIAEIFASIQGEGTRAGLPTAFVRVAGCALRCRWCDTTWAFEGGEVMGVDEVAEAVLATGLRHVCLTGGEPLLQAAIPGLAHRLAVREGLDVVVETGGDRDISLLPAPVVRVLDIKLPGSGMMDRMDRANLGRLRPGDEVKMVVADRRDYEEARRIVREELAGFRGEVLLAPVHGELDPAELADWILADRLAVRFQLQLHKVVWPGRERGA